MKYHCKGIRVCGWADESVLSTCPAHDRVELQDIERIYKQLGQLHLGRDIHESVKKQTEE